MMRRILTGVLLLTLLGATGCMTATAFRQVMESRRAIEKADKAVAGGDYSAGAKSYLKARRLLVDARGAGLEYFADDKKIGAVDLALKDLDRRATEAGFIRVGSRYLKGEELARDLAGQLEILFLKGRIPSIPQERVVPESVKATVRDAPDNRHRIALSIVLKQMPEEREFAQDAWTVVKFLLEGGYGHGFDYHLAHAFRDRPWMGREGIWGISDKRNAEDHFVGLKGRLDQLSISIYRGSYRGREDERYGPYGFKSLEAVGPYWAGEHFRTYTMEGDDAARLNWEQAGRIPDAAFYELLSISESEPAATAAVKPKGTTADGKIQTTK